MTGMGATLLMPEGSKGVLFHRKKGTPLNRGGSKMWRPFIFPPVTEGLHGNLIGQLLVETLTKLQQRVARLD